MKTKLLRFCLTALMLLVTTVCHAYQACIDGIYYDFSGSNATVTYLYYYSPDNSAAYIGDVVIPSTVDYNGKTYAVTSIDDRAFYGCSSLTSVIIPESVTTIGNNAFINCSSLTSVTIPESLTTIGYCAFQNCSSLSSVTIPESVTTIENAAFSGCSSLTSVNIPESVTTISRNAFFGCSSLTSVNIPESVTSIDQRAFFGCSSLTSVIIPESVTTIGVCVFQGCSSLTSVTIPESVTTIDLGAFEGCTSLTSVNITNLEAWCKIIFYSSSNPLYYAHHLFLNGEEVKDLVIPESVTTIGRNAFDGCTSLISITIPESVTTIDDGAFRGCTQLYEVINHSHLPIIAGSDTYGGVAKYAKNVYSDALEEVSLVAADDPDHEITDDYTQVISYNNQDWVDYSQSYDLQEHLAVKFGDENAVSITDMPEGYSVRYTFAYGDVSYFTPITADGKLSPQLPNGKPATTACVGKNAIWRIEIMYGDDVVEVGYYRVTIAGEAVTVTAPAVVADDILKVASKPTDVALNKNLSLDNVWNKIVEVTGEDLDVVKDKYSVTTADDKVAQYTEYKAEGDRTLYKNYEGKGDIKLNADGSVNWNVRDSVSYVGSELRSLSTDVVKSMTTYIRVRSNDAISKDTYNEFYMPLVWTPKPIEHWGEYQELSWTYTRVANQWQYNRSTREEAELRLYADLTKTGTTPFTYNIAQKAMKNFDYTMLDFVGTAKDFVNVQNGNIVPVDGHFRFIEHPNPAARKMIVNGDTYNFTVSADGKQLRAAKDTETPVVIATITEQGVVNLVNNTTSQLLLNAYENNQLDYGQTLCARVGFAASCCAGVVKVIDGDFDVRFIRPLTVNAADINISDAEANGNTGTITTRILNNIICFNSYTLAERPNYIETFGARIELGNVADWKTNYNAAADDFTKNLNENYIADRFVAYPNSGEISYSPGTLSTNAFSVLVPVTVHYNWGTVSQTININIPKTVGSTDIYNELSNQAEVRYATYHTEYMRAVEDLYRLKDFYTSEEVNSKLWEEILADINARCNKLDDDLKKLENAYHEYDSNRISSERLSELMSQLDILDKKVQDGEVTIPASDQILTILRERYDHVIAGWEYMRDFQKRGAALWEQVMDLIHSQSYLDVDEDESIVALVDVVAETSENFRHSYLNAHNQRWYPHDKGSGVNNWGPVGEDHKDSNGCCVEEKQAIESAYTAFLNAYYDLLLAVNRVAFINVSSNDETMGIVYGSGEYEVDTEVILTAIPAEGFEFMQWSDGTTENPYVFTAKENKELVATFQKTENEEPASPDLSELAHAIYAEDVDVLVGKSIVLPLRLKNTAAITSFQFDLRLPEGVTIATDSYGDADIQLATERTTLARHSLSYNEQSNGDMRVVCTSLKNATFSGNDGNVVIVRLNIAEGMEEGDYPIVLSNIEMSEPDMTKHKVPLYTSKLHIDDYLLGDVDGDREVTVTDVTGVVNIILGIPMTNANEKAADVSGDGEVTVTDATGVVNIILGIPNGSSARRAPRTTDAALNVAPFSVIAGETVEVPIVLQSGADEFTGMQFDLVLPAGLRLIDVATDRRHNADFATRNEGTERIVSLSLSNATYAGNGTAALTLTLATDSDVEGGNILLDGIELVRPDLSNVRIGALSAPFAVAGTTGINLPTSQPNNLKTSIYDLQGRKTRGAVKGVYMQNGQKVIK